MGIPCEMYETVSEAGATVPGGGDGTDFGPLLYTLIPAGATGFSISPGLGTDHPWHPATSYPNGNTVGAFGFQLGLQVPPGSGNCAANIVPIPYPAITLVDAPLPDFTSGPWAGAPPDLLPPRAQRLPARQLSSTRRSGRQTLSPTHLRTPTTRAALR